MTPAFASWHDFVAMGGYAFYVWLAVAGTLVPLFALILHSRWSHRRLLADIRQRDARERRLRTANVQRTANHTAGEEK
ncbi:MULTISPECIES: heme exporter protein CcmD [Pantoea]|uniref:heme exporter protein CcmD n=1 Tax=Pantoea TaxID=53335 RepID=UPI00049758C5|nr:MULTISPECIES: heme exporter protein CcmD [Pantoea]MDN4129304.1 heme exporter protein CcmD [Pantoea ananatis]MDN4151633.1 heme exporter protein CcmD [Pantoea ananatis]OWY75736.1 heme exporter protein CcmD [Pantoea sp. AMG 501]PKC35378.1 CcmD [Pantoea ananatis 15320]PQK88661.1 heme exporter protein CcmD [Pantoea ananatis]